MMHAKHWARILDMTLDRIRICCGVFSKERWAGIISFHWIQRNMHTCNRKRPHCTVPRMRRPNNVLHVFACFNVLVHQ
jgi:hypothetical protein